MSCSRQAITIFSSCPASNAVFALCNRWRNVISENRSRKKSSTFGALGIRGSAGFVVLRAIGPAGCASQRAKQVSPADAHALIGRVMPSGVADRSGWTNDIYTGFTAQALEPTHESICAVIAVIEQESGFHVNPVVPGLPTIAWQEIRTRAEHAGVPWMLVHGALGLSSPT